METMNNDVIENGGVETTNETNENKTFTYEEVMALIQSESDKRTN